MTRPQSGAEAVCSALESSGVEIVFGLPGTQTVGLYEALRRSRLRAVVPTHEMAAAFMATGYARASGKVGVILTIPGPGFAYAVAGVAEASLDGVPLLHICLKPARGPTGEPAFQAIEQTTIAGTMVKRVFSVGDRESLPGILRNALEVASTPEQGPVYVELSERILSVTRDDGADLPEPSVTPGIAQGIDETVARILAARRPVLLIASDCSRHGSTIAEVADSVRIPVCVPAPGRGVVAEDHPWCLTFDDQRTDVALLNATLARADLAVVLGTRLGHVATAGFRLKLPANVICIAADVTRSLSHGYGTALTLRVDPGDFLALLERESSRSLSEWTAAEMTEARNQFASQRPADPPEPEIDGASAADFFAALRDVLPRDAIVVTDSGLHQVMVRRHFPVLSGGGLIFPSDFQSMGFGLPAALGAKLAAPDRCVIAIVGDGGFAMNGLELLTAVRDRIPVIVLVMNDGRLNLIRVQQLREFGRAHGVDLNNPDLEYLSAALGVRYLRLSGDHAKVLAGVTSTQEATVVDVPVGDSPGIRRVRARSLVRATARNALGPSLVAWLKRRLR
jgi:acetolactate synthase-1/2/3 large subunit